jgi:hypothetical protein
MSIKVFLIGVLILICVAIVSLFAARRHTSVGTRKPIHTIISLWLGITILLISAQFFWTAPSESKSQSLRTFDDKDEVAVTNRPIQVPMGDFVGSTACQSCHPHNHATWYDSYHRTMTQVATEQSVLGDFNDVQLFGKDLTVRLFKKEKRFFAEMTQSNPHRTGIFPVVMTTGSHNRQAYWLASSPSSRRLVILPYMFLREEKKWIPRHSGYISPGSLEDRPELTVLHSDSGKWSSVCIQCHATNGRREALDVATDNSARRISGTLVTEFGISCEACHGPGAQHIRVHQNPLARNEQGLPRRSDPTIVNPAKLPHDRSAEVCGQCHVYKNFFSEQDESKWARYGDTYRPGDQLSLHRVILQGSSEVMLHDRQKTWNRLYERMDPTPTKFWSDGMIRATGREYTALLDSACFQKGEMSCLSCHQMHQPAGESRKRSDWTNEQLKLGMEGNAACLQCHDRFKHVDQLTQHTHHFPDSVGSRCYNCHMPYTTYGILKAERSHQISSPSVQKSLQTGRPNACNQCHQDKTLAWTAESLANWYKTPKPKLSEDETQVAATVLWTLRGDAGQRALMAWSYGWQDAYQASGNHWQAPYLGQLLEDHYDAVRIIANRSLRRLPGFDDFEFDPTRPLEQRASAHQRVMETWKRSQQSLKRPFPKEVLIDAEGSLFEAPFQRLWRLRDDSVMAIAE